VVQRLARASVLSVAVAAAFAPPEAAAHLSVPPPERGDRFVVDRWTTGEGLPQNSITDLHQDERGYLWLTTFGGLARYDGSGFDVFDLLGAGAADPSRLVRMSGLDDGLLLTTEGGELIRWRDGRATPEGPAPQRTGPDLEREVFGGTFASVVGPDGARWTLTAAGLVRGEGASAELIADLPDDGFSGDLVFDAANERLWLSRGGALVLREGQGAFERVPLPGHDDRYPIRALLVDREGALWVGTDGGGLLQVRDRRVVHFGADAGLAAPSVRTVLEGDDGRLWIGAGCGDLHYWQDGRFVAVELEEPHSGCVRALATDGDGDLWFGADQTLVHRASDGTLRSWGAIIDEKPRCLKRLGFSRSRLPRPHLRLEPFGDLVAGRRQPMIRILAH